MTFVVAHRGASTHGAGEHDGGLPAGVEAGADAIELDVHLTADGQLAVIHDDTLDRTTDRTGPIVEPDDGRDPRGRCRRDVRRTATGSSVPRPGPTVPTLPEVLEWLPETIGLVIEIKARAAADAVVEAVRDHPARASGAAGRHQLRRGCDRARPRARSRDSDRLPARADPAHRAALVWATEHGHTGVYPWEGDIGIDPLPMMAQATAFGRRGRLLRRQRPGTDAAPRRTGLWGFVTDVPDVAREALGPR